ncbi:MAG: STAS domain-containing protein [Burkholderiales bacterium]|nr:STAS domain-containing protein [Burkholderiales bacterium]MDE2394721.1 STAS domain-containing protein [Burkholderiales bacterium]MDE2453425.1 STAS domain-containing protein [Burkholderiales bacterium]
MQLPATATLAQAGALLAQLDAAPDAIDASALVVFDTSTLALLLEARRRAAARGARLAVHGAPAKLRELARLYDVEELLSLEPT